MEELITILSVGKPWDLSQPDGNHFTGCTMWYVSGDDLSRPVVDLQNGLLGVVPTKETMGVNFYDLAKQHGVPCVAKATYGMRRKNNQTVLYIKGVDFVEKKNK